MRRQVFIPRWWKWRNNKLSPAVLSFTKRHQSVSLIQFLCSKNITNATKTQWDATSGATSTSGTRHSKATPHKPCKISTTKTRIHLNYLYRHNIFLYFENIESSALCLQKSNVSVLHAWNWFWSARLLIILASCSQILETYLHARIYLLFPGHLDQWRHALSPISVTLSLSLSPQLRKSYFPLIQLQHTVECGYIPVFFLH